MQIIQRSVALAAFILFAFLSLNLPNVAISDEPAKTPTQPTGWDADASNGYFELIGAGNETASALSSAPLALEPRKPYRFTFKASCFGDGSGDVSPCGVGLAHYDFQGYPQCEIPNKEYSLVFLASEQDAQTQCSLGQWNTTRAFRFADPKLNAVQPVYRLIERQNAQKGTERDVLTLGVGESLDASGAYRFRSLTSTNENTNFDRPLYTVNARFNTSRWIMSDGASLVYRFALNPVKLRLDGESSGSSEALEPLRIVGGIFLIELEYYVAGRLVVEASVDGENWSEVGRNEWGGKSAGDFDSFIDGRALDSLYVRLRSESGWDGKGCNFQIVNFSVELQTKSDDAGFVGEGATLFADLDQEDAGSDPSAPNATLWGFEPDPDVGTEVFYMRDADGKIWRAPLDSALCSKIGEKRDGGVTNVRYAFKLRRPAVVTKRLSFAETSYFRQTATREIAGTKDAASGVSLSWAVPEIQIPREPKSVEIRPSKGEPIKIAAPKNDFESFQIAVRPTRGDLHNLSAQVVGDLTGADGATISASNVKLRYAYYHFVSNPTDELGAVGWYPDALVPLEQGSDGEGAPLDVPNGQNLPIWATVKIPADARSGVYRGTIRLTGRSVSDSANTALDVLVSFELTVWDITLPEKPTLESGYGIDEIQLFTYCNAKTEEDKRALLDLYWKSFSEHRLSPIEATFLDPIKVKWNPNADPPGCDVDSTAFENEIKRLVEQYRFNTLRVVPERIDGVAIPEDSELQQADFDSPNWQAAFADYGRKLQESFRKQGLLDVLILDLYDEPTRDDYEKVAKSLGVFKRYMPKIRTRLTEEPGDEFTRLIDQYGGKVDVWIPLSPSYSAAEAKKRRDAGEKSWVYVCTIPKAPYCAEFIDHPTIELRIWHWQAFERDIVGTLIWATNYWSSVEPASSAAQNPYLDPQSYIGGTLPDARKYWGNCDGRFLYPPLRAATPGRNDGKPIIEAPNESMRWETLREGAEDYELFSMLKNLANERKLTPKQQEVVGRLLDFSPITTSWTDFSTDPDILYKRRAEIASAIVALRRLPIMENKK